MNTSEKEPIRKEIIDTLTQMLIENFLRFDLSKLNYKDVFQQSLYFPALIAAYDEKEGQHLTKVLEQIKNEKYDNHFDVKTQIENFDKFFCHKIWNRFPNVEKYDVSAK